MNSISRNKYIDKSATPLKAYFTLASARERAQTTYAPARVRTHTHVQAGRHLAAREKEEEEKERESETERKSEESGCTYRRVVCSVYKESCLFLADGYRRKTICLRDLECFVSPPSPTFFSSFCSLAPLISSDPRAPFRFPPFYAISRRVIHDANKTSFLPIVHRPIHYRGPIRRWTWNEGSIDLAA